MGIFGGGRKRTWLIVSHRWFASNGYGFEHELLADATKGEAEAYAAKIQQERDSSHNKCETVAIKLPDEIAVVHHYREREEVE